MKTIIVGILALLLFSACGSKGDKSTFDDRTPGGVTSSTTENRVTVTKCSSYVNIETGDVLKKDSEDTVVRFQLESDGTKKVCTVSGSAYLVRN